MVSKRAALFWTQGTGGTSEGAGMGGGGMGGGGEGGGEENHFLLFSHFFFEEAFVVERPDGDKALRLRWGPCDDFEARHQPAEDASQFIQHSS